jgi:signal peptidase I
VGNLALALDAALQPLLRARQLKAGSFLRRHGSLFLILLATFVFRSFGAEAFNIPSGSAIPTLLIGDHIVVSKYAYGYSRYSLDFVPPGAIEFLHGRLFATEPKRGDVIVFVNPHDGETLVKRLVGLPGDRIQMIHGVLHINGKPVARERVADYVDNEPDFPTVPRYHYLETLPNGVKHDILGAPTDMAQDSMAQDDTPEYVVPAGHYFGMGDNRENSTDSRFLSQVGYIPAENLIGRAEFQAISTKDGAPVWQFWKWLDGIRYGRFLQPIH